MSKNPFSASEAIINSVRSRGEQLVKRENNILRYKESNENERVDKIVDSMKYLADSMVEVTKTFSQAMINAKPSVTINVFVQTEGDIEKVKSIIGEVIE